MKNSFSTVKYTFEFLKSRPNEKYTAIEIAEEIIKEHKEEAEYKKNNSLQKFNSEKDFLNQVRAEIGSSLASLIKSNIKRTAGKPMYLYYQDANLNIDKVLEKPELIEKDLYQKLMDFLLSEKDIYSKRIDEKKSKNDKGENGNKWLYPDIVGVKNLQQNYIDIVKKTIATAKANLLQFYAFEVKIFLKSSNVRKDFFQCVSNSSWANFAYLVAIDIDEDIMPELEMLCTLHGVGVIKLDEKNIYDSEILIYAREKEKVDWTTINRIAEQNKDFKEYLELISDYYSTNKIIESLWDGKKL
jgi:hypothetical protein